jgi:predicted ATPase/class 3 adenylate cyclase
VSTRRLPSGTVTFLFTDIEGSTRLLQEHGDRYASLLAEHRRALREVFERHHGVEVDTQGDAFFVAFARATDAVAAARDGQAALGDGPIRVRMGLHTGEPVVTEEGYVGLDVHRAARIAGVAHGEQVLLSRSTRDLAGADVVELGPHRLKDLTAPEVLFQLGQREFPPLRSLHRTNLPLEPNPLVGRDRELAELKRLLSGDSRLVTLTGPGGSGKTRLALQAGAELAEEFPDGVWFVSLSAVDDSALVEPAIAQIVDLRAPLTRTLRDKRLLLVLDNFEQVVGAAATIADVLASAAQVRVIITSRERLAIGAETEFVVPMLSDEDGTTLFLERARALRPDLQPDEHVKEIVRRLDALPLALELAAARVKVLTTEQIRDRLGSSLDLLCGGGRDAPERHRTLRATIEWSIALLEPDEREWFARLGVFPAGFDLDAAEGAAGVSLDGLSSLVDKSLLRETAAGRLFMFEAIRAYAAEQFATLADTDQRKHRHAEFFLGLIERIEPGLRGEDQARNLAQLEQDHANFRAALAYAVSSADAELGLRLAGGLMTFWFMHGHLDEGRRWLGEVLAIDNGDYPARARALFGAALLATLQADWLEAKRLSEECRTRSLELGEAALSAQALLTLGRAVLGLGDPEGALLALQEAAGAAREIGATHTLAMASLNLGYAALTMGDHERARTEMVAAHDAFDSLQDLYGVSRSLAGLGSVAIHQSRRDDAVRHLRGSIELSSASGDEDTMAWAVELLAAALAERNPTLAVTLLGAAEALRARLGTTLEGVDLLLHDVILDGLGSTLGELEFAELYECGRASPIEETVRRALADCAS